MYGLLPQQKCLLYRTCILPIALCEFSLWHYNNVLLAYPFKELRKIQKRAALWILEAFYTSLTLRIKAIAILVPIHLHLQKLSGWHQLRISTLPNNYAIKSFFKRRHVENTSSYCLSLENLTSKQQLKIKSSVIHINNCLNGVFSAFDSLNNEFSLDFHLIDIFSSCFSFHHANHRNKKSKVTHICRLDECIFKASTDFKSVVIISDTSIKNNVTTFITYVHSFSNSIKKIIHHTANIILTGAKLFTIRCGINQAIQVSGVSHIIVIMDAIYVAHQFILTNINQ